MAKRKLIDHLPKKKPKASVRLEIDRDLYEEAQKRLKKRGNTVTDLVETAFRQFLEETDSERKS